MKGNTVKLKIRIAAPIMERLREYHLSDGKRTEALSYIWARAIVRPDRILVLVPHNAPLKLFAPDCFVRQSAGNVQLQPDVLNGMLVGFAATDYNCLINIHDHWFDERTRFSGIDDNDDVTFDRYLRESFEPMLAQHPHIGPARPVFNLSIVLAQQGVDARLVDSRHKQYFLQAKQFDVIGERFERLTVGRTSKGTATDEIFCRQQDFIPADKQALLGGMTVALAGCGGLGSILAESLARSGFGSLVLIDDDSIDTSNLNRWQGGCPDQVGKSKAKILAGNLRRMFPGLHTEVLEKSLYDPLAEPLLAGADLLVAGLDNDEARYFLNRVSLQYGIPYFDAGVEITGRADTLDFRTRFFAVIPGVTACLECTQLTLFDRVGTLDAYLDAVTAQARRNAGYVTDQSQISSPSVYALNQRAASMMMTELLNYICGWRPLATSITESWRCVQLERLGRDIFPETPDHECPVCGYYSGAGDTETLPRPRKHRMEPMFSAFAANSPHQLLGTGSATQEVERPPHKRVQEDKAMGVI